MLVLAVAVKGLIGGTLVTLAWAILVGLGC